MGYLISATRPPRRQYFFAVLSLVIIECLVYGPFLRSVGFYHDDWPVVTIYSLFGRSGIQTYFTGNRPVIGWLTNHLFSVLGVHPFAWHLIMLVTVALTGIAAFCTVRALWPGRLDIAWLTGALILLYPGFTQQSESISFLPHYVSLLLFLLSLRVTIAALDRTGPAWTLTGTAIVLGLASYSMIEYFIGLELFRFLVILYRRHSRGTVGKTIAPYFATWVPFILWIDLFGESDTGNSYRDPKQGLHQLLHHPLYGLVDRVAAYAHNLFFGSVLAWVRPIGPELLNRSVRGLIVEYALGAVVFIVAFLVLRSLRKTEVPERGFYLKLSLAIGGLLVSGIPLLVSTLRSDFVPFPSYPDRYTLPFILTSALLLAVLLLRVNSVTLTAGVLALFAVFQAQTQASYRQEWRLQRSLFWQLAWRAPMLKPGTGVYLDGIPQSLLHNHNSGMLGVMYGDKPAPRTLGYYIFDLELYDQPNLMVGSIATGWVREYKFRGQIADSLVTYLSPRGVLYTIDGNSHQGRSGICDALAPISAPERVIEDTPRNSYPLLKIFGAEPQHDFLYYYQKAELRRQEHAWGDVAQLGDAALRGGYLVSEGDELLPFIEGYARVGRYDAAEKLTAQALQMSPQIEQPLSALWRSILAQPSSTSPVPVVQALGKELDLTPRSRILVTSESEVEVVGPDRIERSTSRLSSERSSHLIYRPLQIHPGVEGQYPRVDGPRSPAHQLGVDVNTWAATKLDMP